MSDVVAIGGLFDVAGDVLDAGQMAIDAARSGGAQGLHDIRTPGVRAPGLGPIPTSPQIPPPSPRPAPTPVPPPAPPAALKGHHALLIGGAVVGSGILLGGIAWAMKRKGRA